MFTNPPTFSPFWGGGVLHSCMISTDTCYSRFRRPKKWENVSTNPAVGKPELWLMRDDLVHCMQYHPWAGVLKCYKNGGMSNTGGEIQQKHSSLAAASTPASSFPPCWCSYFDVLGWWLWSGTIWVINSSSLSHIWP